MASFWAALKKIDQLIDSSMSKIDCVEKKAMQKITKQDIMIDDCLDVAADKAAATVTDTVIPFVKTTATVVKDAVLNKATELKGKLTTTTPPVEEEKEVVCPFDWRAELANDADLAAALKFMYLNPMIRVRVTSDLSRKPLIIDGSAPVVRPVVSATAALQAGVASSMPTPVRVPVLYRMRAFVANAVCRTPMAQCVSNN